ncbi:MAG: DNA methyltransferase [Candidatus Firestonebacteria bacterium]
MRVVINQNCLIKKSEKSNGLSYLDIIRLFKEVKINNAWAFSDKTRKDTAYLTHGYHRYPAKFIPQIVSRLVEKYTKENEIVVDPFAGCGTTLVESKVMGRHSIGVDINPVAVLITKAKITAINPLKLEKQIIDIKYKINAYNKNLKIHTSTHERIDYWFKPEEKKKLTYIFSIISKLKDQDIRDYFYCGFSNILKNCSIWMQKSNKPTRDLKKTPSDPISIFLKQVKMMSRGNANIYNLLKTREFLNIPCKIYCKDARDIPTQDNSVCLIVTSPPYVTSYEYADLHQLTALWFDYTKDLSDFRKRFIGTSYNVKNGVDLNSEIAESIKDQLFVKDKSTSEEVSTYFGEMNQVFCEIKRILKKGGKTCIVIGNTNLKGVEILNAEVFTEQLQNLGFTIYDIIKREIPSKNLPSTRDKKTGRFASIGSKNKIYAYPTEYIVIMEKV